MKLKLIHGLPFATCHLPMNTLHGMDVDCCSLTGYFVKSNKVNDLNQKTAVFKGTTLLPKHKIKRKISKFRRKLKAYVAVQFEK